MLKQDEMKTQLLDKLPALLQPTVELEASETERKQVEEVLEKSKGLSRGLIEAATVGIYIVQNGKFQYVSPHIRHFFLKFLKAYTTS